MSDDFAAPPPPYEVSQQEFDQKTAQALQISQSTARDGNGEVWETWDEAAYQEAAARQADGSAGSSSVAEGPRPGKQHADDPLSFGSSVEPLRIVKKPRPKERPTWLVDDAGGSSSGPSVGPDNMNIEHTSIVHNIPPDDDEDRSMPPPAFTAQGPSLDGPPFEEVVLAYHGNGSNPPSPLSSPRPRHSPLPSHSHARYASPARSPPPHTQASRQSLPTQRRVQQHSYSRPATSFSPPTRGVHNSIGPRLEFNPLVAYSAEPDISAAPSVNEAQEVFNAASFYNSAVTAHLAPVPSKTAMHSNQTQPANNSYHGRSHSSSYPRQSGGFVPGDTRAPVPPSSFKRLPPRPQQRISRGP